MLPNYQLNWKGDWQDIEVRGKLLFLWGNSVFYDSEVGFKV